MVGPHTNQAKYDLSGLLFAIFVLFVACVLIYYQIKVKYYLLVLHIKILTPVLSISVLKIYSFMSVLHSLSESIGLRVLYEKCTSLFGFSISFSLLFTSNKFAVFALICWISRDSVFFSFRFIYKF